MQRKRGAYPKKKSVSKKDNPSKTVLTLVTTSQYNKHGRRFVDAMCFWGPLDATILRPQQPSCYAPLHVPYALEILVRRIGGHWAVGLCDGFVNSQGYFYCGEPSCPFSVKLVKVGRGRGCTYKSIDSLLFPHHLHSEKKAQVKNVFLTETHAQRA